MKLTKEEVESIYDENVSKKTYDSVIKKIDERFGEVIKLVIPTINRNGGWFDYANCSYRDEGQSGHFDTGSYRDEIYVGGNCRFPQPYNDSGIGCGYIPTRWLWTDDEEIKKEFTKETEVYKKEVEKKKVYNKAKRIETIKKNLQLEESIRSKLTKEELKFINFK